MTKIEKKIVHLESGEYVRERARALKAEIDFLELEKARIEKAIKSRAKRLFILLFVGAIYAAYLIFFVFKTI